VSCLACTSSATSLAWAPSAITVRLANSSRNPREDRHGARSGHSPRLRAGSPADTRLTVTSPRGRAHLLF
jgi:hypothetical protein